MSPTIQEKRQRLADAIRVRRPEIEQTVLTRVAAVSGGVEVRDPEYLETRWAAAQAAIDYCLMAIESSEEHPPPLPDVVLSGARMAARYRVSLDVILRRYFAGYTLVADYLIAEAESGHVLDGSEIQRLMRTASFLFDQLVSAVSDEYNREAARRLDSTAERRLERIRRLIAGEVFDTSDFGYDFSAWHLGVVVTGQEAEPPMRALASRLDRHLLIVQCGPDTFSAWLGGREPLQRSRVERALLDSPLHLNAGFGEPARGLAGWRLSYRQACAAMRVAVRRGQPQAFHSDVVIEATLISDDLLSASLRQMYLDPLDSARDGGTQLRETLRAYFGCGMNLSSAAAQLGVSRRTVANRLQLIEERLGRPLHTISLEVEAALRLDELDALASRVDRRGAAAAVDAA